MRAPARPPSLAWYRELRHWAWLLRWRLQTIEDGYLLRSEIDGYEVRKRTLAAVERFVVSESNRRYVDLRRWNLCVAKTQETST